MEALNKFISTLLPLTDAPMFVLLICGGLFLVLYSRFLPYRYFGHAIAITAGKYDGDKAKGDVSSFQALSAAVAATVGLGNISGVAIAIHDGGPGVVFWIWMTALLGMAIKFYSGSLAVMFRGEDSEGKMQGGPMYYIINGLGKNYKPLAIFFSIFGLFRIPGCFYGQSIHGDLYECGQSGRNHLRDNDFQLAAFHRFCLGHYLGCGHLRRADKDCQSGLRHRPLYGAAVFVGRGGGGVYEFFGGRQRLRDSSCPKPGTWIRLSKGAFGD